MANARVLARAWAQRPKRMVSQVVTLNYQQPDPGGRQTGRYIGQPDKGDVVDVSAPREVVMHDARRVEPAPRLSTFGFECRSWPTQVEDFTDDGKIRRAYYDEMADLVRAASGASLVLVFDHTIRDTANSNLNALPGGSAAPVPRVHCDYTAEGAPRRLEQLLRSGELYEGSARRQFEASEIETLVGSNFAFINVWRSIDPDAPVQRQPLAVLDEESVDFDRDAFVYELRFPDRTGENYSLQHDASHKWFYYPHMGFDECLVFKCYDRKEDGPRFVFHTAFDDPSTPPDAPPRRSIETRTIAFFPRLETTEEKATHKGKELFLDMKCSNNAARIRLWLNIATDRVEERRGSVDDRIQTRVVEYPDLATDAFQRINPLKKVPALVRHDGATVFESQVILNYLEDKYGNRAFTLDTPEERQVADLMVRCHDIYVASPNCTAAGFSHCQGSMYLSAEWHGERRGMTPASRAAKLEELWKQVTFLDRYLVGDPFLAGKHVSLADLTWYPTCCFMEYMLPRVFGWPQLFDHESEHTPTPRLAQWFNFATNADPAFAAVRTTILDYWRDMDEKGQFDPIVNEIKNAPNFKWLYP
ncbi:hypothetical protein CTAYLR_005926 [Chrysophaeum taylorii]|uniref:Glutathione S-transferase n=1 Tax=Chrysophaeum taylorii TaxID=2483200 RepID=A0AAD7UDA2_9STRA|nr:hypothetical protein CTAYLR_005926 [Chrysophaeum taylorii]